MTSRRVSPVLVGRDAEMGVLREAFEAADGGTPQVVLLGGEAGGGKSRLVTEFTAHVRDRALVLAGGCVDLGAADLPYAPFTAALRDLVRQHGPAEVTGLLPGNGARELARLLPELGSPAADSDPEMTRGRLFGALLTLLDQLAGQRPLMLVIEDLHWADRSTGDLLAFLVRNLRDGPVLLVVTFRSDEVDDAPGLSRLLAELGRMDGVTRLELTRLSRGQVAAQLEGILGRPADPALAGAVYQRGGGNPLFTEALLGSDGVISPGLPWSLRELLLSRIKELPAQTQQVLRTAAVGDGTTGHELLAAVTGLDDPGLDDALRHSVSAGVLVADGDGYAFRHELFREALREDLLPGERTRAHRAFATALAASPALSPGHLPMVRLAVHWHGAGEHEQALRAASAAAADAAGASAYAEQLQMLELVLEVWERAPDAARQAGTDRAGVMEAAAEAARLAGEPDRGLPLVEAALGDLDEAQDGQRLASLLRLRAALRQQLLLPGQADDLRAALRLAADPSPVRAQALGQLIRALRLRNLDDEAKPLVTQLRSLAERLPDEKDRVEAQIRLAHYGDGVADLQERAEEGRRIGSASQEIHARLGITHLLETRGQHEAAIRAGQQDLARARQLGLARYATAPVAGNLADSLISAGRWDEATEIIADGLSLNLAPFGRAPLLLCSGQIAVARGDLETANQMLTELRAFPAAEAETQRALPLTRLELEVLRADGDLDGALAIADTVPAAEGKDPRYLWPLLAAAMRACADAAITGSPAGTGDHASPQSILADVAAASPRPGPVERAHAAVVAAESARVSGHPDQTAWDTAAAAWEAIGQPYPLAYALLRAASAAAADGNRDAAAARLPKAAGLAARLGAQPLLQQITRLAQRARIDLPPAAGHTEPAARFGLTDREMEVLRLVAAGRSNRDIAAELFISPKTASVHVTNILAKLGVHTRVEAAAIAHRSALTGNP